MQNLENTYAATKKQYAESLHNLEIISEEIHTKRNEKFKEKGEQEIIPEAAPSSVERGECIGAEDDQINKPANQSRRRSELRRMSNERIKNALTQCRVPRKTSLGRYRHSLLLDLDVDLDVDDSDSDDTPKSPGSKSIDMGCVNMNYYEDYQVLDVLPFLERERQSSVVKRPSISREDQDQIKLHVASDGFSDSDMSEISTPVRSRSASEFEVISAHSIERIRNDIPELIRSNTVPTREFRRHSRPVIITDEDIQKELRDYSRARKMERRESRTALTNRFSLIQELDGDMLDDVPATGGSCTEVKQEVQHQTKSDITLDEPNCLEIQNQSKRCQIQKQSQVDNPDIENVDYAATSQNSSEEIQNDLQHISIDIDVARVKTDITVSQNIPSDIKDNLKHIPIDDSSVVTTDKIVLQNSSGRIEDNLKDFPIVDVVCNDTISDKCSTEEKHTDSKTSSKEDNSSDKTSCATSLENCSTEIQNDLKKDI